MKNKVKDFFVANQAMLTSLHPGLTLHTLTREIDWLNTLHGFKLDLNDFFDELLTGKPLAYCVGYQYFYDAFYKVEPCTLIPRPESELIVARALELAANKKVRFADIGTGTGAIGLAIARNHASCEGVLSDISGDALTLAQHNYFCQKSRFAQSSKCEFIVSDRFEKISGEFDLIVSNPPYIKAQADLDQVSEQVKRYEPALALFLPDEEYTQWFTVFFNQVLAHLKPSGYFLMEGHEAHLDDLALLMGRSNKWKKIAVVPDLSGRARFIESQKNG